MICLVEISGQDNAERRRMQITSEGMQFLQAAHGPLAVISVTGQPQSGKSSLARRLLECRAEGTLVDFPPNTLGLWACPEILKVSHEDELGQMKEFSILLLDTEGLMARGELSLATKLFALTTLLSSHMVYWT
jgi:hypothetical protein